VKHVEFCSKNKFEKLVHLVGFIIRRQKQLGGMMLIFYSERWRQSIPLKCQNKAHSKVYKPEGQPTFAKQLP